MHNYYSEEMVRVPGGYAEVEGDEHGGGTLGASGAKKCAIVRAHSRNAKLGFISTTTYASQVTCPQPGKDARPCPLFGHGCYGESGRPGVFMRPLNRSHCSRAEAAKAEASAINQLVGRVAEPLRIHTVGDCPTVDGAALVAEAATRYMYASGAPAYTYTHAWNVPRAAWGQVSVLRSCHTIEECYEALDTCYAPALLVDYYQQQGKCVIARGLTGIPCPAISSKNDLVCPECRLCWNDMKLRNERKVIMFAAHGLQEGSAREVAFSPKCIRQGV